MAYQCSKCNRDIEGRPLATGEILIDVCTNCGTAPRALLNEAYSTVYNDRRTQYGAPEDEFANIAIMWSAITGTNVTARQVALMMIALKLCRENMNHKHDNLIDIIGYTLCLERVVD